MRPAQCLSRTRRFVIYGSAVMAVKGLVLALVVWHGMGSAAGVDPGFIICLCEWIVGTIVCSMSVIMPDQARIFAVAFERGRQAEVEQGRRRHLSVV